MSTKTGAAGPFEVRFGTRPASLMLRQAPCNGSTGEKTSLTLR